MGIGNKPFMDIQPSDAAINDRAVNYVLIGRGKQWFTYLFNTLILVSRQCDGFFQLITLLLITHILTWSLQKTGCCPLWDHVVHRTGFPGVGQNLLVQEAVRLPPLPLVEVPCPRWDICVGQSGGELQGALEDMYRLLELWRRMTWTMRVGATTYCVSLLCTTQQTWS